MMRYVKGTVFSFTKPIAATKCNKRSLVDSLKFERYCVYLRKAIVLVLFKGACLFYRTSCTIIFFEKSCVKCTVLKTLC